MKKHRAPKTATHRRGSGGAPTYYECPECGYLTADQRFGNHEIVCPVCSAYGDGRRVFPTDRLRRLDARIRKYHHDGEPEIVVILAETFLESILEDIIDRILTAQGATVNVREVVLDAQRAIGARIGRLFPTLTGEEFEEAAAELGFREFPRRWRELRKARNAFIHDSPFRGPQEALTEEDSATAMELLDQAYALFVLINNRFAVRSGARSGDTQGN
ncbi:MAG: hypothetical protein KGZ89_03900 [Actinobacteria bacterium]|nr:hypothetical protein [Actinomycetota bacterium]